VERVPDATCAAAIERMVPHFRDGRFADGLVAGIEHLADAAGPGEAGPDDTELPDILGG